MLPLIVSICKLMEWTESNPAHWSLVCSFVKCTVVCSFVSWNWFRAKLEMFSLFGFGLHQSEILKQMLSNAFVGTFSKTSPINGVLDPRQAATRVCRCKQLSYWCGNATRRPSPPEDGKNEDAWEHDVHPIHLDIKTSSEHLSKQRHQRLPLQAPTDILACWHSNVMCNMPLN